MTTRMMNTMDTKEKSFSGIIYKITCVINGKVYIGQTTLPFKHRLSDHKRCRSNFYLSRAILKHGWHNFTHEVLECGITSKETLDEREKFWIAQFNSTNRKRGFNLREGGGRGNHSPETRKRMTELRQDPEYKAACAARTSQSWTPERRVLQSESGKRQFENPEQMKLVRERALDRWKRRPQDRLALAERNRKQKTNGNEKRWADPSEHDKLREANLKRWANPENRRKQSETMKAIWARRKENKN
jgi:group I intron endonuclease